MLAGVCNGLAAYSEIRVDWVRTLFVGATLLTAGAFVLVYVALVFILPVDADARCLGGGAALTAGSSNRKCADIAVGAPVVVRRKTQAPASAGVLAVDVVVPSGPAMR